MKSEDLFNFFLFSKYDMCLAFSSKRKILNTSISNRSETHVWAGFTTMRSGVD